MQHDKYVERARKQQEEEVPIPAPRGSILDRNGQPLAISVPAASVSVNPQQMADPKMASEVLASYLKLDQAVLYNRLATARHNHKGFLWVKHDLDPFETERLKSLQTWRTRRFLYRLSDRHYPGGETAAHVLGGLGVIPKEGAVVQGVLGIERGLDKVLRGQDGSESVLMDVHHNGIDSKVDSVERPGTQLTLSIDSRMQYVAERELKAGVIAKHARSGTAIVMNPYTGEILALANYPTYDPNQTYNRQEDPIARFDLGASVPFEPGSMFKVITLTAAASRRDDEPDAGFDDSHRQRECCRAGSAGPRGSRVSWWIWDHQHGRRAGEVFQYWSDSDRHQSWQREHVRVCAPVWVRTEKRHSAACGIAGGFCDH